MDLVCRKHRRALQTVFWFLGGNIGALEIMNKFEDRLEGWED